MKVFAVGGSVRDRLMGLESNDNDFVVVGATEQEMLDLGYKNVGESFPVFLHPETGDQYALARRERKTGTGYRGFSVEFDPSITLAEDLSRRDLTINAMAQDIHDLNKVYDPYGGYDDLQSKTLRHVSDAFAEDPLRVVRLARFYGRFDKFTVATDTVALALKLVNSGELDTLADERFWAEMEKAMEQSADQVRFFDALWNFHVLENVKFFKDLFGTVTSAVYFYKFKNVLPYINRLPQDLQLSVFISIVAQVDAEQKSVCLPNRVTRLTSNMRKVRSWKAVTPVDVVKLIGENRGWDPDPKNFVDVISAITVAEKAGERFTVRATMLAHCGDVGRAVKADNYLHLSGAEIGRAMYAARLARVTDVMKG